MITAISKRTTFPTYKRYWNADAQVPWLYNANSQIMISYEDPQSIAIKSDYVKQNHLGGVMIWELDYDNKAHTLLRTIAQSLGLVN
jgi:chitinase